MKQRKLLHYAGACLLLSCACALTGCKDADYDFDNVDMLIGAGGEELELPGNNSTREITLDDFLELNNSDFIHIAANGDYQLSVADENVVTTTARVDAIHLVNAATTSRSVGFDIPRHEGVSLAGIDIPVAEGDIASFEFAPTAVSEDIVALESVSLSSDFRLTITKPSVLKRIDRMELSFPDYLTFSDATATSGGISVSDGNKMTVTGITANRCVIHARITGIKFDDTDGGLGNAAFSPARHEISLSARVKSAITVKGSDIDESASGHVSIGGEVSVADILVKSATGRFSPAIDFDNLGSVSLNNIPNFLTDNQVTLDLYDPHINVEFNSELPLNGTVSGKMEATGAQGENMATVSIPQFTLRSDGSSVVSIRKQYAPDSGDTIMVRVPDITELIRKIPARIDFTEIHAQSDSTATVTIEMNRDYEITGRYSVECPLQFDDEAVVVYVDSIDDWNDDVKDITFKETTVDGQKTIDGYLQVRAEVSNSIPAYITVSAVGIETGGREISSGDLEVTVDKTIPASADGSTPVDATVTVKLQPKNNAVFKRLNGLKFRLTASAADTSGESSATVVGKTINAYSQTLKATSITVTKHGKIVYDAN